MKVLLLTLVVLAVVPACQSAQRRSVSSKLNSREAGFASIASHLNLGPRANFRPDAEARTAKGNIRKKFRQEYAGMAVVGTIADVEMTRGGQMRGSIVGTVAYNLENDIPDPAACQRTKKELINKSKNYLKNTVHININGNTDLENVKVSRKVDFEGEDAPAKIVYELEYFVDIAPTPIRPFFQMDACDSELSVIRYFNQIQNFTMGGSIRREMQKRQEACDTTPTPTTTPSGPCPSSAPGVGLGGNQKIGVINYGVDTPYCLKTEVSGSTCTMNSKYAVVIDLNQTRSDTGRTAVEFQCAEGYDDAINGAYGIANDAFYYGYSTGAMYEEWYGFFALGYAPKLRVHYDQCYENAFWNGVDMTFGDGCSRFFPLVSQDVVGHELGHGITSTYSNLLYQGQSGGINEAFSDMSGEVVEAYSTRSNDWKMGYDIFKAENEALRYMNDPTKDGRSIDSFNDYYNGLNVHYSSGIFNKAFYELVTTQGIPIRQAYEIFLHANKVLWGELTAFQEGACSAMKAAYDLGLDQDKVKAAFLVVDIDLTSCNYNSFSQVLENGETRDQVMVSSYRNPVFELDTAEMGATIIIDVASDIKEPVTVSVTSDAGGKNVVASGEAPFSFDYSSETKYFKLSTTNENDVTIEVSASSA